MSYIKRIKLKDLRLGMYLHGFDGSWMTHPFWRCGFVLQKQADLRTAQVSGLLECWIDTSKGDDVATVAAEAEAGADTDADADADTEPGLSASIPRTAPQSGMPTTFDEEMQHAAALCKGARSATLSMFNEARLGNAIDAQQCLPLVNEIADSVLRNPGALISLARLKTSDDYTYMHSVAVCALMVALGQAMDLDQDACRQAGVAGLLHDIGKATIPLEILNKPGKLTDEEFEAVKQHPVRGHEVLVRGQGASEAVLDVCLHHHEKFDGSGYPHRLKGEAISLMARMAAVCDVYDAITSNRPYKGGWDPAVSVARMISWTGHFDLVVLSAFIKTLGIYPTGALVKMKSDRLAVVLEQNQELLTKPVVKIFFSTRDKTYLAPERLNLALPGATDSIVGTEDRANWNFKNLDDLWAGDLASGAA